MHKFYISLMFLTLGFCFAFSQEPLQITPTSLEITANSGKQTAGTIALENIGLGNLELSFEIRDPSVSKNAFDDAIILNDTPDEMICFTSDPETGFLYAVAAFSRFFYRYDPPSDTWQNLADAPLSSGSGGMAAWHQGKIYHVFRSEDTLAIYTVATNSWTTLPLPRDGFHLIASDGNQLFMLGYNFFYSFDPSQQTFNELPLTTGTSWLGMAYNDGYIYASKSSFSGSFFRYQIATQTWETLPPVPGFIQAGAATDSRHYFVGGPQFNGVIKKFNYASQTWSAEATIPFQIREPYLVHSRNFLYVIPGRYGDSFAKFPQHDTIYLDTFNTSLAGGESQPLKVLFDARGLQPGTYQKVLAIETSDIVNPYIEVPIVLTVVDGPAMEISTDALEFGTTFNTVPLQKELEISNCGTEMLVIFDLTVTAPEFQLDIQGLKVPPGESRYLPITFESASSGVFSGELLLESNDGNAVVALSGASEAPPVLHFDASPIQQTVVNGGSANQWRTLTNQGDTTLTLSHQLTLASPGSWFRIPVFPNDLEPGESADIELKFNAAGLLAGIHQATLAITTNDPALPLLNIPVQMTVTGTPKIEVSLKPLDFGDVFIDAQAVLNLQIGNTGTMDLDISAITASLPDYVADPHQLVLAPMTSTQITVTFSPQNVGQKPATLSLINNDTPVDIPLLGTGVLGPEIQLSPALIEVELPFGGTSQDLVEVANFGSSTLEGQVDVQVLVPEGQTGQARSLQTSFYKNLAQLPRFPTFLAPDPATGYIYYQTGFRQEILRYDPFHNRWETLSYPPLDLGNELGGAVVLNSRLYCFFNHSTDLQILDIANDTWSHQAVGMQGRAIETDGNAIFLSGSGLFKVYHPDTETLTELAAITSDPFDQHENLIHRDGFLYALRGSVELTFERYNIALDQWESLPVPPQPVFKMGTQFKGQIIFPGYLLLMAYDPDAGIWTEHPFPELFHNPRFFVSNNDQLYFTHGNLSRDFASIRPAGWVDLPVNQFSVAPGSTQDLDILFSADELEPGDHWANLVAQSNDPNQPTTEVLVHLTVEEAPDIQFSPRLLNFGDTFLGQTKTLPLYVRNHGQLPLSVTDLLLSHPDFQIIGAPLTLEPGAEHTFEVAFTPTALDEQMAMLTLQNTVANQEVGLLGIGIDPPGLGVDVTGFHITMDAGQMQVETMTLTNHGQSPLEIIALPQNVLPLAPFSLGPRQVSDAAETVENPGSHRGILTTELADLTGTHIGIFSGPSGVLPTDLMNRGAEITYLFELPDDLSEFDVLWIPSYSNRLDDEDIAPLHQWLFAGGSLMVDGRASIAYSRTVPAELGFQHLIGSPVTGSTENIHDHFATRGIRSIRLDSYFCYFEHPRRAIPLIDYGDDSLNQGRHLAMGALHGDGKVALVADDVFNSFDITYYDTQAFANQLFDWLAIKAPGWIQLSTQGFTLQPGESREINVTFDGIRLFGGSYTGEIHLMSNDPNNQLIVLPVDMTLVGTANAVLDVHTLDFGHTLAGTSTVRSFEISNPGTETLAVSSITTSLPDIVFSNETFPIEPGMSQIVYATFQPTDVHHLDGDIVVASQLPDLEIAVTGSSQLPPDIALNPGSLSMTITGGLIDTIPFDVVNEGLGPLHFHVFKDRILIIGDGGSENELVSILEDQGYQTFVVDDDTVYTGSPHPRDYAATILLDGVNSGGDMPAQGQQTLVDYVQTGGNLLVFEWLEIEINEGRYQTLAPLLALQRNLSQAGSFDYEHGGNHPILTDVPTSFTLETGSNIGSAVAGEVLVTSPQAGDVIVLNTVGQGAVLQFASAVNWGGYRPLQNPHFAKLVTNAVSWLGDSPLEIDQPLQTVRPLTSQRVQLTVDTQNLDVGTHSFNLAVASDDPDSELLSLPLTVQVPCQLPQDYWDGVTNWLQTTDVTHLIDLINQPCK